MMPAYLKFDFARVRLVFLPITLIATAAFSSVVVADGNEVSFNRDIRPLLSSRCFACHGPDGDSREAGLRLDQPHGDEGAIGFAIEPGSIDDSELWRRITSDDEYELMPPPESHLKPFSPDEQQLIRQWIQSGADYEGFWAFELPIEAIIPEVQNRSWSDQAIDLRVLKKMESRGRSPSAEAEPRTLIRRLTLDLTGLPPTRDEIRQFVAAYETMPDLAWEKTIDDLLSRPAFGEHFARYWLDLVRFADTNGMHKDFYRNHVAYRDWVIRAFNDNLPYSDFVRYQIAGDLFEQPTTDQHIASGFNRLHLIIDRGTALPEESFTKNVIDRVTAVGTAFMGLTVQCAQCHDHKFDPITQKDFFSLYAFFNNIDAEPETERNPPGGIQPPFVRLATAETIAEIASLEKKIHDLEVQRKELARQAKETTAVARDAEVKADDAEKIESVDRLKELDNEVKALRTGLATLDGSTGKAMVMKERDEVRETFVLNRGQYDDPGEKVQRNTPGFLMPLKTTGDVATRMDLAEWFVDPQNPLTPRVAVNRFWQTFFGVGLVETSEDFGNQGEVPSHPELLDDLAVGFVDSGWDIKSLLKRIVMSKTYRQSSHGQPDQFRTDPENRLLARGPRFRLDAEVIRDQILMTSGLLSKTMFGPSVKPPQPPGLWEAVSMTGEQYQSDQGDAIHRRSVYTFWKRAMPPPQMTIFNAPFRDACIARRERTNTPTQALLLLNESQYLIAARHLAETILDQPDADRIKFAWETVTGRLPNETETSLLCELLDDLRSKYRDNPDLAAELCRGRESEHADGHAELAAWTILGNTLYNLDITKTKD